MFADMRTYTFAIAGCGKLAHLIVDALLKGLLPQYQLIASYSRTFDKAQQIADKVDPKKEGYACKACRSFDELLQLQPDYIVEAASPSAFKEWALPALSQGASLITLSIGALADADFYKRVMQAASDNNARVHLASGAIGGFDVLRTVSLMEQSEVTFTTQKSPHSLKGTSVYNDALQSEQSEVFAGNASEAIALFPTRVNVAVAAALASVGPENLKVSINSIPDFVGDDHRIELKSEQVHAVVDIYSKTSQIAGWSVVNTMRNIVSPIVF